MAFLTSKDSNRRRPLLPRRSGRRTPKLTVLWTLRDSFKDAYELPQSFENSLGAAKVRSTSTLSCPTFIAQQYKERVMQRNLVVLVSLTGDPASERPATHQAGHIYGMRRRS